MSKKNKESVEKEFTHDVEAYAPKFNEERKQFDMYIFKLNSETNEVHLEIDETNYSEFHRASSDLTLRNINEMNRQLKLKGKK